MVSQCHLLCGTGTDWEFLGKAVFRRKMLIYQESIFNMGASSFMQFLAQVEVYGGTLRERKPKIAASPWFKAVAREHLNPCTLSSSGLGGCVCLCQRHTNFYGRGYGAWLHCRQKPRT